MESMKTAEGKAALLTSGLAASPGVAVGIVARSYGPFARKVIEAGGTVVLVREETSPDDLAGMLASVAFVTARGGATSHAAVVARGVGRPAVVGCGEVALLALPEGLTVTVDGTAGKVYQGALPLVAPVEDEYLATARAWLAETPTGKLRAKLAAQVERQTRKLDAMFRHYLLLAVIGELRHTRRCADGSSTFFARLAKAGVPQDGNHNRSATQDLVADKVRGRQTTREFLDLAVEVFTLMSWGASFGGKKWGEIAATLRDRLIWSDSKGAEGLPPAVFVDRVFDLQHNGGAVFDKRKDRIRFNPGRLKEFLDAKFKATTAAELEGWLAQDTQTAELLLETRSLGLLRPVGTVQAATPVKVKAKAASVVLPHNAKAKCNLTCPCVGKDIKSAGSRASK